MSKNDERGEGGGEPRGLSEVWCTTFHPLQHVRARSHVAVFGSLAASLLAIFFSFRFCFFSVHSPPPRAPGSVVSFSLSHLHQALHTCLRVTRPIEYLRLSRALPSFLPRSDSHTDFPTPPPSVGYLSPAPTYTLLFSVLTNKMRTRKKYL